MPEVLAALPVLSPSAGLLPGAGSGSVRGAGFGAALRGSLRDYAPSDGDSLSDPAAAADVPVAGVAPAAPWLVLFPMSAVGIGHATGAASTQEGTKSTAPIGAGAPVGSLNLQLAPASVQVTVDVRRPDGSVDGTGRAGGKAPGVGKNAAPGPGLATDRRAEGPALTPSAAAVPLFDTAVQTNPSPARWEGVASTGEPGEDRSRATSLPVEQGFEGKPFSGPVQPDRPLPSTGARMAERRVAGDTSRPTAALGHVSAGFVAVADEDPLPTADPFASGATGDEGIGERRAVEREGLAAIPIPPVQVSIAYGGPDDAHAAMPTRTAPPTQAAAPAGVVPADAPRTPVVAQVAAALALYARDGLTEVTITLRPPELGEVRARIIVAPDGLVIRLSADHEAVGALLRARAGELHQALAAQQMPVVEVHVLHNPPPTPSAAAPDWQGWQEWWWLRREPGQQERQPGGEGAGQEAEDEA